jgi:hypothetical protein
MNAIPASYLSIIEPLIGTAREILERGESLVPFAFVGNLTTGQTYPVMLKAGSEAEKDDSASLIRDIAHRVEADFVFVIMEAWALPPDKVRRVREIIERYGSVGASPYRIDVASFALETRHGMWVAQTPIKPRGVSKKKRTFGAPAFQHFTDAEGRFAGLLPVKDPGEAGAGTLH